MQEKVQLLPISEEVAVPFRGAVHSLNSPLHPEHLHHVSPNFQLLPTQLALSRIAIKESSNDLKQRKE